MRKRLVSSFLIVAGLWISSASAAPVVPGAGVVKLDPNVTRAIETGLTGPSQLGSPRPGHATVLLELTHSVTAADLAALAQAGAQLKQVQGRTLYYGRFVPAAVDSSGAAKLAAMPAVARISLAGARGPLPLDRSAQILRLADARGGRPDVGDLTGKGVVIADLDSVVDPFHPTFFKGDGGYFDWIDNDKDGVLTPGVDAIDLDRNGVADPSEVAVLLSAATVDSEDKPVPMARATGFDPGIDWLFLDTNGNGKRDYGVASGFDDTAPALGEPLFVPDDVNKNGKLDVGERVVRLQTSKFRKIYNEFTNPTPVNDVFVRGVNLSQAVIDYTKGAAFGFADSLHATGVNTILVGDVPLVGRRWVGIAPEADVVVVADETGSLPTDGFTWVLGENPDVALFEIAPWTGYPLDGSDPLSQMIDAAVTDDNLTATCPTGDQGSAHKHTRAQLAAGASKTLELNIPAQALDRFTGALTYVDISVNVRGGSLQDIVLTGPKGDTRSVITTPQGTLGSGSIYYGTRQMSPRGTDFIDIILYAGSQLGMSTGPLDVGNWTIAITGDASKAVTVDAYVSDDKSSWTIGAAWDASIATDVATVGIPSVADHCIAVNAQPDHLATAATPWYEVFYGANALPPGYTDMEGQIRAYTPLGPRIDGVIKPDVTAPDNPWVATQHDDQSTTAYGSFHVFGGTSGASPHVTGTAVLLAQAGIKGDAARDAIRMGAVSDSTTGTVPNANYGYGRLDTAGALGIKTIGKDFTVSLASTPERPTVADKISLVATAAGDPDAILGLKAEWDDGYDGTWDAAYADVAPHAITATMPGTYPYKVRVMNSGGHVAEAVLWVTVTKAPPGCGCEVGARQPPIALGPVFLIGICLSLVRLRTRQRA